jgi:hypothetical protein
MRADPSLGGAAVNPRSAGGAMALKDWKFAILLVLVIGMMTLLFMNVRVADANRAKLQEVAERQQFLSQTVGISQFSTQFIKGLARVAAEAKDEDIRRVLADHGVTFTVEEEAQGEAASGQNDDGEDKE